MIDGLSVKEKPVMTKSMAASKNLPKPILKASQGASWIRVLAAELSLRLKEAREISPNLWPKTIALGVRKGGKLSFISFVWWFTGVILRI
jgi:DNA polymerase eta